MPKRIVRSRRLTNAEDARAEAIRAEFAHRPRKSELLTSGKYVGPMSIEEYLAWRRGEADAPP